jgi:hypothetical protein
VGGGRCGRAGWWWEKGGAGGGEALFATRCCDAPAHPYSLYPVVASSPVFLHKHFDGSLLPACVSFLTMLCALACLLSVCPRATRFCHALLSAAITALLHRVTAASLAVHCAPSIYRMTRVQWRCKT